LIRHFRNASKGELRLQYKDFFVEARGSNQTLRHVFAQSFHFIEQESCRRIQTSIRDESNSASSEPITNWRAGLVQGGVETVAQRSLSPSAEHPTISGPLTEVRSKGSA